jgi:hypothetical protein
VQPERELVGELLPVDLDRFFARGLLVGHVEDLIARPEVLFRRAVAIQAPPHEEWLGLESHRHLIDAAMAGRAADALMNVDLMIEVDEVR